MTQTRQHKIGPITLAPGITPWQVFVFIVVSSLLSFSNNFALVMQPLVLIQQLNIPRSSQGSVSGALGSVQQFGLVLFLGIGGSLADIVGRRWLMISATIGFAVCLIIYPLLGVLWALFVLRFFWGVSYTGWTVGGATKAIDYPDNNSRGRFLSLILLSSSGLGALFSAYFSSPLAKNLQKMGFSAGESSRYAFWIMAGLLLIGTAFGLFLMQPDKPQPKAETIGGRGEAFKTLAANVIDIFRHARKSPRLAMILVIGCVIRSDYVILHSFLSLWVVNAAGLKGISAIEATGTAGKLLAIVSGTGVVATLVSGYLADKIDRAHLLTISLVLTTLAFLSFGLVPDVFGVWMIAAVTFVGLADGCQNISAQSMIATEAPPHLRGSAMGVFAFLGTVSVIGINMLGGKLFDLVGFSAPLVMEGVLHGLFLLAALWFLWKAHRLKQSRAVAAG